ncbi:hypothetical protein STRTUCAR8_02398 [Streptomyces turgidiscabies Car8]|uniref:Uncharacterized protein n=1 Tax=Streptomyces turgidiscabies (strain Car8) TaxID=698760 RepID=L7FCV0_STRT8|nr:hypothetical protein STRTUCAR8_02398 [Streptomyces turgidiscabies Car8]
MVCGRRGEFRPGTPCVRRAVTVGGRRRVGHCQWRAVWSSSWK